MPIEKDLKRIADALETLVAQGKMVDKPDKAIPKTATEVTTSAPVVPPAPAEVVPTAVVPPAPAAPAAPAAALTPEALNEILVAEFKRIGDRKPIDDAMALLGVISVTDLPAEKQQELIAAVRAIPA